MYVRKYVCMYVCMYELVCMYGRERQGGDEQQLERSREEELYSLRKRARGLQISGS